jgi:hypothetical protein
VTPRVTEDWRDRHPPLGIAVLVEN